MRLIDADELMDFISEHAEQIQYAIEHKDMEILEPLIKQIPTAYDVDKVVEQLEWEKDFAYADFDRYAEEKGLDKEQDFFSEGMKRAIEIVKGGGIK